MSDFDRCGCKFDKHTAECIVWCEFHLNAVMEGRKLQREKDAVIADNMNIENTNSGWTSFGDIAKAIREQAIE